MNPILERSSTYRALIKLGFPEQRAQALVISGDVYRLIDMQLLDKLARTLNAAVRQAKGLALKAGHRSSESVKG